MNLENIKINFLGDSITEGAGVSCSENVYVSLVSKMTGATCRNYGIGGTRIARQHSPSFNPREDLDFCMRATEMDKDADIVFVFGGTNDFGHGDAPLGEFADRTPDTFYGGMHTLCNILIERYLNSSIIFISPLHRLNEDKSDDTRKGGKGLPLKTYVNAIKEVCEYYSLPVLDFYAQSGLQPNVSAIKEAYMPDGLHPNDEGHKIMANKIVAFLKSIS